MAEGKNIEIKIAATGGNQAAAEIGKVEAAAENLSGGKGTGKGLKAIQEETQKVTAANVKMGTGMQNVGYQVQDLAVQIGSGTSAFRALGQQLPQLLSGFGPVGIALGTISAVAIPVAGAIFTIGDSAKTANGQIDRLNTALDNHADKVKKTVTAKREADNDAWLKSLDQEEQYYEKLNAQTSRSIILQAKLRGDKAAADDAEREARIAEIEADPKKLATDKITEVSAIREEAAQAKLNNRKKELEGAAILAKAAAADAKAKADRQTADAAAATKAREEKEAKVAELDAKVVAGGVAQKNLPILEKRLKNVGAEFAVSAGPGARPSDAQIKEVDEQKKRITAEIQAAKNAIAAGAGAGSALVKTEKELTDKREAEKSQKKEAESARAEAETAYGKSVVANTEVRLRGPEFDRQAESERQQRAARSQASLRAAAAAEEAKRQQADLEARQGKLTDTAAANQARIQNGGKATGQRPKTDGGLQDIAKDIGSADTEREIAAVAAKINAAQGQLGAATVAALTQMLASQQEQAKAIETLRQQIKNK